MLTRSGIGVSICTDHALLPLAQSAAPLPFLLQVGVPPLRVGVY